MCVSYVTQSIEFHSQINNFFLYLIEAIFKSNKKKREPSVPFVVIIPQITLCTLIHFISCAASAASIATATA